MLLGWKGGMSWKRCIRFPSFLPLHLALLFPTAHLAPVHPEMQVSLPVLIRGVAGTHRRFPTPTVFPTLLRPASEREPESGLWGRAGAGRPCLLCLAGYVASVMSSPRFVVFAAWRRGAERPLAICAHLSTIRICFFL